jgi:monoamine oxidase
MQSRRDLLRNAALASAWKTLPAATRSRHVLVIGAGLAGLSAAYELEQAGHRVTIFEARDRPGGRVHTLREPFSNGLYAEAGAESFGDNHNFVQHYVKQFDLPVMPTFPPSRLRTLYYMSGKALKEDRSGVEWPVKMSEGEQKISWFALQAKYITPAAKEIGDPLAPGWPSREILDKYDRLSFREMLARRGATPEAIAILQAGYSDVPDNGTGADSALCSLRDEAIGRNMRLQQRILGGNDRLPKAFLDRIRGRVEYGAALMRIVQNRSSVTAVFEKRARHHQVSADFLVCAIPFTTLRMVENTFPENKRRAISELRYQSVTRVYLESSSRYWNAQGWLGYAMTDLPVMTVWDCSAPLPGDSGILECYISGEHARRIAALPGADRVRTAKDQVDALFPGMRANFVHGASVCWDDEPWSRGAFAWFKANQMTELLPHVASREGRVFFAGEHTSPWFGWMQGALESGRRAAAEVNQAP